MSTLFGNTLVTGATGLLGTELVSQLLESKESSKIICLIRDQLPHSRFSLEKMHEKVLVVQGDLRNQDLLDRILNEYEVNTVFHLGAQTLVGQANARPAETLDVNIRGTWSLLEAVKLNQKHVKTTIVASSDKAYGNLNGEKYTETFPLQGSHPYDVSKSCADLISQCYAHSFHLNIGITRCGNFFGPGDLNESRLIPSTILSLLRGEEPLIRSNGEYVRDYIFVADGAAAYRLLAKHMIQSQQFMGEAFNFSYGLRLSVLEVVSIITKLMGSNLKPKILNEAKNEIPLQCLDSAKAHRLLNWKADYGFEEGIRKTIHWYKENILRL